MSFVLRPYFPQSLNQESLVRVLILRGSLHLNGLELKRINYYITWIISET